MQVQRESNPTLKGRLLNLEVPIITIQGSLYINDRVRPVKWKKLSTTAKHKSGKSWPKSIKALSPPFCQIRLTSSGPFWPKNLKISTTKCTARLKYRKKHISEQKEKNNQLVELIGIVKNEKLRLQDHLALLEERIEDIENRIGMPKRQFWSKVAI